MLDMFVDEHYDKKCAAEAISRTYSFYFMFLAAGLFKFIWSFSGQQTLKDYCQPKIYLFQLLVAHGLMIQQFGSNILWSNHLTW